MLLVGRSGEVERYGILPSVPSLENQLMYVYVRYTTRVNVYTRLVDSQLFVSFVHK